MAAIGEARLANPLTGLDENQRDGLLENRLWQMPNGNPAPAIRLSRNSRFSHRKMHEHNCHRRYRLPAARLLSWLRAALLPAMAVLAVQSMTSTARASCGDYLDHAGRPMDLGASRVDSGASSERPQVPCHGPGCREAPHPPAAPTAPFQHASPVEVALLIASSCCAGQIGWKHASCVQRLPHSRSIAPLDRPPR